MQALSRQLALEYHVSFYVSTDPVPPKALYFLIFHFFVLSAYLMVALQRLRVPNEQKTRPLELK
jgi:hypothetical protein